MEALALILFVAALAAPDLAAGQDAETAPEGWLVKAARATADDDLDAYDQGYDFAEGEAEMLADTWRLHDAMTQERMDTDLEDIAVETAAMVAAELSPETQQVLEGVEEGLSDAGETISFDEIVGWNAFMDLSPYWAAEIDDDYPGPRNGRLIAVGGTLYSVQTANRPYSLTAPERNTLRFELAAGDAWKQDSRRNHRAEIARPVYPAGETITITYDMMIEPGAANKAKWLLIGQIHADDLKTSPLVAIELVGERMVVRARFARDGHRDAMRLYRDYEDIERGRFYRMKIKAQFPEQEGGRGTVEVWRDGARIVDYEGPLGYGYGVYWKVGIYRRRTPETLAVNIRDLFVAGDQGMLVRTEDDDGAD